MPVTISLSTHSEHATFAAINKARAAHTCIQPGHNNMPVLLKINLDSKNKIYAPGAEVTGSVDVRDILRQSFTISGLACRIVGTIYTFQHFVYHELNETVDVVNDVLPLVEGDTKITKSNRTFKFAFQLPKNLPPSVYVTSRNYISYRIEAYIPGSKASLAFRNIYIVFRLPKEVIGFQTIQCTTQVPVADGDVLITYGDSNYPEVPAQASTRILGVAGKDDKEASKETTTECATDDEKNGFVERVYTKASSESAPSLAPPTKFEHSEKYPSGITMQVEFPYPGLFTDEEVQVSVKLLIGGDLPAMTLQSLKITIVEYTKLKAKEMTNTHSRPYVLFRIDKPIDLTTSTMHDFSAEIRAKARFPDQLAPNFKSDTMSRWYVISVHSQIAKASVMQEMTIQHENRLHLNARQFVEVYGQNRDSLLVPVYSKQY